MPVTAVLDACVLYPAPLRDLLLHLAAAGVFRARWTAQIHAEWMTAVERDRPDLADGRLDRTRALMDRAVPGAMVEGHLALIPTLTLPDPEDRHVLAAAIGSGADVIVTSNLRDFPAAVLAGWGLVAMPPDPFIGGLLRSERDQVLAAMRRHRAALVRPPSTPDAYIGALRRQGLQSTALLVERYRGMI